MTSRQTVLHPVWNVFLGLGVLHAASGAAERPVLIVGKQGAQYTAIQAAIDAAPEGAILRIGPGEYEGGLRIEKPLTLEGDGWERTTILAPPPSTEGTEQAAREAMRQVEQVKAPQERSAIWQAFLDKYLRPAILICKTRGVEIRNLKVTCQGLPVQERICPEAHVVLRGAGAKIVGCAILGSSGSAILLADGSEAEVHESLVAGLWGTGIEIGARDGQAKCRATVVGCDVRNCHYAGIIIRKGSDATIERCRISGAAWHGIRYDDCSPMILANRIFGNYRSGIYASGKTAATIRQNLFLRNSMSCWFDNRDTIIENTFAGNGNDGLYVLGASQPAVERNLFFGHKQGIVCGPISGPGQAAKSVGSPHLKQNLFWKTATPLVRRNTEKVPGEEQEQVRLAADTQSAVLDPQFVNPEAEGFSLRPDSPARRDRIGVTDPLPVVSPWPLQPEEQAIIPEGPSRDENLWKKPTAKPETMAPAASPLKPAAGPRPPIVLLFHRDPAVRIRAIETLAATLDRGLIDDLIRAHAVEYYTPVHNAYLKALQAMTGQRAPRGPGAWKAWLAQEVAAGRLKIDYLPLELAILPPDQRAAIQPLAAQLGPEHFDHMVLDLTTRGRGTETRSVALRYMVANDHRPDVQKFLQSGWLVQFLALDDSDPAMINSLGYVLSSLANPGPLREGINRQLRECLASKDPIVLANALHLLAGVEGYSTRFVVPDVADKVRGLLDHPAPQVAAQAHRAINRVDPVWAAGEVSYEESLRDLYEVLGREYPCFSLKGIDWKAVGQELLPRVKQVKGEAEFGLLCMELVARLEDSHATVDRGTAAPPVPPLPRWDPGFACLLDDRGRPVVYYVDRDGPADKAGVRPGMTVLSVNGRQAEDALAGQMRQLSRYAGYSSERYLRYHAAQFLPRQMEQNTMVRLELEDVSGGKRSLQLPASLGVRYLPRLPVPIPGISDSADVAWKMLDGQIGYLYVRRIGARLIEQLDRAIGELSGARGLIIDVRGNSGGGFDPLRAHRNFALNDAEELQHPRFAGPIAVLIDARCISAGEGWTSWFVAQKRARLFGQATTGASSRKRAYLLKNGLYTVTFPVKAYTGYLDRPIERRGLEPDVPLRPSAWDLAAGRDTVLEAAKRYLGEQR